MAALVASIYSSVLIQMELFFYLRSHFLCAQVHEAMYAQ
jgi:hypothetical protein